MRLFVAPYTLLDHPDRIVEGLLRTIADSYGINLLSLEHMPVGFVGVHFKGRDSGGSSYFLTVYDGSRLAQISVQRLPFTLAAVHHLQHSGQFTSLAAPLKTTRGRLWAEYEGLPVIVYPYLEGHLLAEEGDSSEPVQEELGRLVAKLHAAHIHPGIENPIREEFRFPFEEPLRRGMLDLQHIPDGAPAEKQALRDLLLPHTDKINSLLSRLHALAYVVRQAVRPYVICHTDLHPWNVIRALSGELVVVDWEGVCLAPPEYDLFIFTGPGFRPFLRAYYEAGGRRDLSAEAFAFYLYRRNLEDLADFIVRILDEDGGPERDRQDLQGIQQTCMAGWADLETAVERMWEELAQV